MARRVRSLVWCPPPLNILAVSKEAFMKLKLITPALAIAALARTSSPVFARGCLKGAAVGAVAGHFAHHHGMAGAAAGCAVGKVMAHHPIHMHHR
jgi:hypothetical protein